MFYTMQPKLLLIWRFSLAPSTPSPSPLSVSLASLISTDKIYFIYAFYERFKFTFNCASDTKIAEIV